MREGEYGRDEVGFKHRESLGYIRGILPMVLQQHGSVEVSSDVSTLECKGTSVHKSD